MTPNEIHNKQFDKSMSGYRPDDVNAFLIQVANYVEDLIEDKSVLEQKMAILADKLEEYREDEDSLRAALIGAQKLGDSVVRESKRKAEQILQDAQQKADEMVADIKRNVDRENDTLNKLQAEVARFKNQILSLYRQHIELFNAIPYDEKDYPVRKHQEPAATHAESKNKPDSPPKPEAVPEERKPPIVVFDDDASYEYEEVADDAIKKDSRHGNLMFGDKYPLTRKE